MGIWGRFVWGLRGRAFGLLLAGLGLCAQGRAAATLSNLVVPATAVAGQDITVSVDFGAGCGYFAIALSPFSSFTCPYSNNYPYPWVLHDTVHYAIGYDTAPDFRGLFAGGLNVGCGPKTLTYTIRIPPDAPSTVYLFAFADDSPMTIWGNNPCTYDALAASAAISVSGSDTTLRVDLLSQRTTGGEGSNVYQMSPVVRNWGTWPVASTRFCVKMSVYEPASPAIVALGGGHFNIATNSGANWGAASATPWTGSVSYSALTLTCDASHKADWTLQSCFTGSVLYIPGNGGYLKPGNDGDSSNTFWNGGSNFTKTDDYSQASALGVGFAGRTEDYHYRLYDSGSLVCEYSSASTQDPLTGQDPCGISACVPPTATPTATPSRTPTLTPSPTASPTATISPTPTPRMALTKTVNTSQATIGDTITYCLGWTNDSGSAQPMVIWDTLNPVLSFVGASAAPTVSGSYLRWDLGSVAAGSSGQICFWARIDGYPQ